MRWLACWTISTEEMKKVGGGRRTGYMCAVSGKASLRDDRIGKASVKGLGQGTPKHWRSSGETSQLEWGEHWEPAGGL